jgi:hypothetical protein
MTTSGCQVSISRFTAIAADCLNATLLLRLVSISIYLISQWPVSTLRNPCSTPSDHA